MQERTYSVVDGFSVGLEGRDRSSEHANDVDGQHRDHALRGSDDVLLIGHLSTVGCHQQVAGVDIRVAVLVFGPVDADERTFDCVVDVPEVVEAVEADERQILFLGNDLNRVVDTHVGRTVDESVACSGHPFPDAVDGALHQADYSRLVLAHPDAEFGTALLVEFGVAAHPGHEVRILVKDGEAALDFCLSSQEARAREAFCQPRRFADFFGTVVEQVFPTVFPRTLEHQLGLRCEQLDVVDFHQEIHWNSSFCER